MKDNLQDRMLQVMSDTCWHSTEELVEKVSHRFSATMHTLKKRGYQFDKRRIQGQQYEYRLVIKSKAIA
ncbi:hypothetical protein ACN23B_07795 [Anabaena sp. FACHB-709]|uniref:Uncharacterized protein n=2 Tax=Nostocaceae TaxID=1162 RepID=A0A1Z4KUE5_ANAVA|nr:MULTISPECIES: hypothetical protein [Nostocaceae]BAY72538.1 hypothetical protein NIES23_53660 [Trichormus variabilis NIES-23]MBD2170913.1 hypothetical protein [Anabaena cylindrica FACHB-318]MBD2262697.1 hypothetical protein [Anabaena sp. FACHB-709]MBD2272244.1 hypothetical protein [Nostoc sp. PCC 7120 = FACHB-418]MBD2283036.1 hypothetical protein [Anabaena cylindrica FACHB-170]